MFGKGLKKMLFLHLNILYGIIKRLMREYRNGIRINTMNKIIKMGRILNKKIK
jgi:hypothetical protein